MTNKKKFDINTPPFIPRMDAAHAPKSSIPTQPVRPRTGLPRESHVSRSIEQDFSSQLEEQLLLNGSYKPKGKKGKVSIDHLLEFQFESHRSDPTSYRPTRKHKQHHNDKKIHLSGMSFINVNYKFIVDYRGDYRPQVVDPNLPFDLSNILRIIIPRGNSCPICLSDEPVAPRMLTACGHILCLSCLLSFMESEPIMKNGKPIKKYKECPLCAAIIRNDDIVPASINPIDERFERPKINEEAVMTLMTRPFDNTLSLPLHLINYHPTFRNYPWYFNSEVEQYSRVLRGDLNYTTEFLQFEKECIQSTYDTEKLLYNDDGIFAQKAIKNIEQEIKLMTTRFDDQLEVPSNALKALDKLVLKPNEDFSENYHIGNTYFFYQTGFNSNVTFILSLLDVRLLKETFGSYSNFPSSLILKIENIKYDEVSPELTKRFKYLSNLPYGTEVGILECDWTDHSMIPEDVYSAFKSELKKRTHKLKMKTRKEESDRIKAMNEQEMKEKEFYARENDWYNHGNDKTEPYSLPPLPNNHSSNTPLSSKPSEDHSSDKQDSNSHQKTLQKTVWGTSIPTTELVIQEDNTDIDWETDELIKKAMEDRESNATSTKGKSRKMKLIILSSNSGRL